MDIAVTMNNRHETMSPGAVTKSIVHHPNLLLLSLLPYSPSPIFCPKKSSSRLQTLAPSSTVTTTFRRRETLILSKSSSSSAELSPLDEEWLRKLPEKKKPLYSHSLPCIEAWLKKLGFRQSTDDRAIWLTENSEWHAQLSLDITDLHIRYLKNGPGDLEKDVERRFSYALSREDIENAILGGP